MPGSHVYGSYLTFQTWTALTSVLLQSHTPAPAVRVLLLHSCYAGSRLAEQRASLCCAICHCFVEGCSQGSDKGCSCCIKALRSLKPS